MKTREAILEPLSFNTRYGFHQQSCSCSCPFAAHCSCGSSAGLSEHPHRVLKKGLRWDDQGRQRLRLFQHPRVPGRIPLCVYSEAEGHSLQGTQVRRTLCPSEQGNSPLRAQRLQQHLHALLKMFIKHEPANKSQQQVVWYHNL